MTWTFLKKWGKDKYNYKGIQYKNNNPASELTYISISEFDDSKFRLTIQAVKGSRMQQQIMETSGVPFEDGRIAFDIYSNIENRSDFYSTILILQKKIALFDDKTLQEIHEFCKFDELEPGLIKNLKNLKHPVEKLIDIIKNDDENKYKACPNILYNLGKSYEKMNDLQSAFDCYTAIDEENPMFLNAAEKIVAMIIEINENPLTAAKQKEENNQICLEYLTAASKKDNKFQIQLNALFHNMLGNTGLTFTYNNVGSSGFLSEMVGVIKEREQLAKKNRELEEQLRILEQRLNETLPRKGNELENEEQQNSKFSPAMFK